MPMWGSCKFQDAFYDIAQDVGSFHEVVMCLVVFVLSIVLVGLFWVLLSFGSYKKLSEHKMAEFAWCLLPSISLLGLCVPSMHYLYMLDEIGEPTLSLKAVGHQWYWSYEFNGKNGSVLGFDSFLDRGGEGYRMLDVDHRMVAPVNTGIRWLVTSTDVIHSFSIPAVMLKADAIPGRINEMPMFVRHCGVLYGQCAEICGANHSFMPIVVEFVPMSVFNRWWSVMCDSLDLVLIS